MTTNNKTAIVTGAGRGIGKGIALALAHEGYNVVVSDINLEEASKVTCEIKDLGVKSLAVKCDVSLKSEVDEMITRITETFGHVDVLVNNAGIFPFKPFIELSEADWDQVLDVNLKGVFLCSQAVSRIMSEGGKIISISSIAAFVGFEGLTHYCASKGGINGLIRALALEFAPKKINVNAVAPGAIDTPGANISADDNVKNQTIASIPWKRMGLPEDIANTVVFLASDKADYITGQTIIVDGGYTLR